MNKKVLTSFLAAVLAATTMIGCGGNSSSSSSTPAKDPSAPKQTEGKNLPELTTEPMEITLWDIATEDH